MAECVECTECEFTLLAESRNVPEPKRWDACPQCGGTDFCFRSE